METIKLLLIEDNPGDARLFRQMLLDSLDHQFTITLANTLRDGLSYLNGGSEPLDVILLDLSLPDSAGLETLQRVREADENTAICVLTGFDDARVGVAALQVGAQDYLVKGDTDAKVLVRALRYAIERRRIETQLRDSNAAYRSLIDDVFDTSMVAVLILDRNFNVVWLNEATEIYFGVRRDDLIGKDKRVLIDQTLKCVFADPDDYAQRLLEAYELGSYTDRFECHVTPGDNRDERWLEHWSQPITAGFLAGGRIEQYTDITDRKLMEFENERLAAQSRELAGVQERQRLARELHDSVSQTIFTTSAMSEAALRQWESKPDKARTLMEEVHNLAVTALAEMRVLLLELRPSALTQTTLKQVFEQYLTPLLRRHAFTNKLDITDVPPLPANVQIAYYRIAQEAINNIVKHAHAEHVRIAVDMQGDQLVMTIEDDGVGFDANEAAGTSLGLGIMEERAREIGALTQIDSVIGRGTRIRVIWNWVEPEEETEGN